MASKASVKEQIKEKVEELRAYVDSIEWPTGIFAKLGKLWTVAQYVVVLIEEAVNIVGPLPSADKEDLAVEIVDDVIKLPFYLEIIDGPAIRVGIKIIVKWFNTITGANAKGISFLHKGPITISV